VSPAANLGLPTAISRLPQFSDENTQLWSRCWVAAGVEEMIPQTGDILPATIGNHGVHILRDDQGGLDGGYNAFQQGSCWSIPAQCSNGAKIDCAYVSCGHSRDRDVLRPTSSEDRLIRQMLGARPSRRVPIRVSTAGPVIFVALPGHDLESVGEQVSACISVLASDSQDLRFHSYFHVDAICNWRYVAARVMQALGAVGADSLSSVVIPPDRVPAALSTGHDVSASQLRQTSVVAGMPNLVVAELPTHRAILTAKPVNLGRTEVAVALYGRGAGPASWSLVAKTWRALLENLVVAVNEDRSSVAHWAADCCNSANVGTP
jgi:hypothetical protein